MGNKCKADRGSAASLARSRSFVVVSPPALPPLALHLDSPHKNSHVRAIQGHPRVRRGEYSPGETPAYRQTDIGESLAARTETLGTPCMFCSSEPSPNALYRLFQRTRSSRLVPCYESLWEAADSTRSKLRMDRH